MGGDEGATLYGWEMLNQADCDWVRSPSSPSRATSPSTTTSAGTGRLPNGILSEGIPHCARISAVADVYDALASARPYKNTWHHEDAIDEIKAKAGVHSIP